jgi:glutamyl-tRNA synthetase
MTTFCRFAPSPTGFLHVGNIRAAIINFLYAKKTGGKFMLRFDDTDIERVKDEYREMIPQDMAWLGLEYDEFVKQSDRLVRYDEARNSLIKSGRLYECYETPEELNLQRKNQIASGIAPIYNRAALNLTSEQKQNLRAQGKAPHYRFLLEEKTVSWDDKIKGRITYEGRHFSDPVLVRDNNVPTYTFCSVVDDIDFGITDIIRGEDHITNTAVQIQIFEALIAAENKGFMPHFAHLALVKASEGKISKREGGFDVKTLRNQGFEAFSVINLLAQIGTSDSIKIYKNFNELVANFDFSKFSKSATNYDLGELENINQKLLQILDFKDVKSRLEDLELDKVDEKFFQIIRPNIVFLHEMKQWWEICKKPASFIVEEKDREFLQMAASLLPQDTTLESCWVNWLDEIKKNTNRKGKELFMPIRFALSGKEHGPEMKYLVNLINRDEILHRLG